MGNAQTGDRAGSKRPAFGRPSSLICACHCHGLASCVDRLPCVNGAPNVELKLIVWDFDETPTVATFPEYPALSFDGFDNKTDKRSCWEMHPSSTRSDKLRDMFTKLGRLVPSMILTKNDRGAELALLLGRAAGALLVGRAIAASHGATSDCWTKGLTLQRCGEAERAAVTANARYAALT